MTSGDLFIIQRRQHVKDLKAKETVAIAEENYELGKKNMKVIQGLSTPFLATNYYSMFQPACL